MKQSINQYKIIHAYSIICVPHDPMSIRQLFFFRRLLFSFEWNVKLQPIYLEGYNQTVAFCLLWINSKFHLINYFKIVKDYFVKITRCLLKIIYGSFKHKLWPFLEYDNKTWDESVYLPTTFFSAENFCYFFWPHNFLVSRNCLEHKQTEMSLVSLKTLSTGIAQKLY